MRDRHRRSTTECIAFEAPDKATADRIRAALEAVDSTWKLAVTTGPNPYADTFLPVHAALISGVYVKVYGLRRVEAAEWETLLGMPSGDA